MKQEDKQLLLKDLCARLPYGVKFQSRHNENGVEGEGTFDFRVDDEFTLGKLKHICELDNCKPYLRPMSSMTDEEKEDFGVFIHIQPKRYNGYTVNCSHYYTISEIDWLNANHFDYRELIEKGLALEAPEGMYEIG